MVGNVLLGVEVNIKPGRLSGRVILLKQPVSCLSTMWERRMLRNQRFGCRQVWSLLQRSHGDAACGSNSFRNADYKSGNVRGNDPALRLRGFGGDRGEGIPAGNPRRVGSPNCTVARRETERGRA